MSSFDVPVYKYIKGKREIIGTTKAEYLKDKQGNDVINPDTKKPYIVPEGYKLENTIKDFIDAKKYGIEKIAELYQYRTDYRRDLQRNFNGKSFGGFVEAFTPIASFDVGIACRAAELSIKTCKQGGGAVNYNNYRNNNKLDISGEYFNNPKNIRNMGNANEYFNIHYYNEPNNSLEQYFEEYRKRTNKVIFGNNETSELNDVQEQNFYALMQNLEHDIKHLSRNEQNEIKTEITNNFLTQAQLGKYSMLGEIEVKENNNFMYSKSSLEEHQKLAQQENSLSQEKTLG